jgi:hypothetical protein
MDILSPSFASYSRSFKEIKIREVTGRTDCISPYVPEILKGKPVF